MWMVRFGTAVSLFRTWDLAPDDQRAAVLTPAESAEAPRQEDEVVIQDFFDELLHWKYVGRIAPERLGTRQIDVRLHSAQDCVVRRIVSAMPVVRKQSTFVY
jgi:hypothetical protein